MSALVYVVDEDTRSHTEIADLLRACGYRTRAYVSTDDILKDAPDDDGASCIVIGMQTGDSVAPDLFDRLSKAGSHLPVIFLTEQSDIRSGIRAIKAGAEDYFTKPLEREEFIGAIDRAVARHRLSYERSGWDRAVTARLLQLTRRERQVFDLVVRAKMNKQVAFELGTTERTVKAHRHNVMEKMQVRTVVELVSCAERLGLLRSATS